jgi:hypothetical protein
MSVHEDLRQLTGQARQLYWAAYRAGDTPARMQALNVLARLSALRAQRAARAVETRICA